jgi:vacuolar-type H+-ATPase subunit F/Vma7
MGLVAVIGEDVAISGYALAGAVLLPADSDDEVRRRWAGLTDEVEVVILTATAAAALGEQRVAAPMPLSVVMPP